MPHSTTAMNSRRPPPILHPAAVVAMSGVAQQLPPPYHPSSQQRRVAATSSRGMKLLLMAAVAFVWLVVVAPMRATQRISASLSQPQSAQQIVERGLREEEEERQRAKSGAAVAAVANSSSSSASIWRDGNAEGAVTGGKASDQQESNIPPPPLSLPAAPSSSSSSGDTGSLPLLLEPSLVWEAKDLYLPLTPEALQGFGRQEEKQRAKRDPSLLAAWREDWDNGALCSARVPECDFFLVDESGTIPSSSSSDADNNRTVAIQPTLFPILRSKCCAEHQKLKQTLFYVLDVLEGYNRWAAAMAAKRGAAVSGGSAEEGHVEPIRFFLDSGTLLSAVRDGGSTLVPWETDIDIGIIGGAPDIIAEAFGTRDVLAKARRGGGAEGNAVNGEGEAGWLGLGEGARRKLLPNIIPSDFILRYDEWWAGSEHGKRQAGDGGGISTDLSAFDSLFPTYKTTLDYDKRRGALPSPSSPPSLSALASTPNHYYEPCITRRRKKSTNKKSSPAERGGAGGGGEVPPPPPPAAAMHAGNGNGNTSKSSVIICKDAHYVYHARDKGASAVDTARVELYSFDRRRAGSNNHKNKKDGSPTEGANSDEGEEAVALTLQTLTQDGVATETVVMPDFLVHPTRPWLSVPYHWVVNTTTDGPQQNDGHASAISPLPDTCRLWGRSVPCPHRPIAYLDNEYMERPGNTRYNVEDSGVWWGRRQKKKKGADGGRSRTAGRLAALSDDDGDYDNAAPNTDTGDGDSANGGVAGLPPLMGRQQKRAKGVGSWRIPRTIHWGERNVMPWRRGGGSKEGGGRPAAAAAGHTKE